MIYPKDFSDEQNVTDLVYEMLCEVMSPNDVEFYSTLEQMVEDILEPNNDTTTDNVLETTRRKFS